MEPLKKGSTNKVDLLAELKSYTDFIQKLSAKAVFRPEALPIRRNKGESPRHVTIRWVIEGACDEQAVNNLLDYLSEKGRNCHINIGIEIMAACQDVMNA